MTDSTDPISVNQASRNQTSSNSRNGEVKILTISSVKPSPENNSLYRPVSPDDPEIIALAESIKKHGVKEPLVVDLSGNILSGHRRHAAAVLAGLQSLPCRVERVDRAIEPDRFLVLLREFNRQREKSFDEKVREHCVSLNPGDAHQSLRNERSLKSFVPVVALPMRGTKSRSEISDAKRPFLAAIVKVLKELRDYWPVSLRQLHYNLLNDAPLIHASKRGSRYKNNLRSYSALSDLATRARLTGEIESGAIEDDTRPVTVTDCHRESGAFIKSQLEGFLHGYFRDLMQSQANHFELLIEKNTAANSIRPVALEFCIPMTSGRGFCSLPPREAIYRRFLASGKEKLVLIICSDFDPSGEEIAHSFARSMRDDFGIASVKPIKAGLTLEQVTTLNLPSSVEPKKSDNNYARFAEKYGPDQNAFELEAVKPDQLQEIVRNVIYSAIDRPMLNREYEQEKLDAVQIQGLRKTVREMLKGFGGAA